MPSDADILNAFALVIPGFSPPALPREPMPRDDPEFTASWLGRALGEDFCCYIEWKDFSSWGVESLHRLRPLREAKVSLSLDELHDEDAIEDDDNEPDEFFMKPLNRQLVPHGLQLIELHCLENPRLVCIRTDPAALDGLRAALRHVGVEVPDVLV